MDTQNNSLDQYLNTSFKKLIPLNFLSLLKNTVELSSNPLVSSMDIMSPKIDEMINYINEVIPSFKTILEEENDKRYERNQVLLTFKDDLAKFFRIAYGYVTELNIISFIIEEQYQILQFKKEEIGVLDYTQFYEECYQFIFKNSNQEEINSKLNEVLRHIPIRITKDKFYDYVEKSISQIDFNSSPEAIEQFFELLKQQFIGTNVGGYGEFLSDISTSIEHFKSIDLVKLNEKEITKLWEEIELVGDTLSNALTILSLLYKIFNTLSIFMMLEHVTLETLYNHHIAYKDFYLSTCSIIDWSYDPTEKEVLFETLPDLLNQHIDILKKDLEENDSKIMEEVNKGHEEILSNEELSKDLQTYQLILYYMNMELLDLFSYRKKNDISKTSEIDLRPYLQDFKNFLNSQLLSMNTTYRKARMQHFLGIIPAIISEKDFIDYLTTSVEMSSSKERKALILSKLGTIMDTYGFFDTHSCDCGHDHEHDHHHDHNHNHHHHH